MIKNYPQYRKYPHGNTYFKIISESEFEEFQILGNQFTVHRFIAKILPDRNYIYDLTHDYEKHWIKITQSDYEKKLEYCELHLINKST